MQKDLCGIDEAGRGPLAGDLVMAGCILHYNINGLHDSKKLSETKREALYEKIIAHSRYHIVKFSPLSIDEDGISLCLQRGLQEIMTSLETDSYLFDGNCNYGLKGLETMIKADGKIPQVSAASILAKVTHDRDILLQAKKYPQYHFQKHKGYGTKLHVAMIKEHGYCEIHRKTYKIKALEKTLFD